MNIDQLVRNYVEFLNQNLNFLINKMKVDEDYLNDWMQANWELLVEFELEDEVTLEVIGDGADLNGQSSRVIYPERVENHCIKCSSKIGKEILELSENKAVDFKLLTFDNFVNWNGTQYNICEPINAVLMRDERDKVQIIPIEDIRFELQKIVPE